MVTITVKLRYEKIRITDILKTDTLADLIFFLDDHISEMLKDKKFLTSKFREINPSTVLFSIDSYGKLANKKTKNKKDNNIIIYARDLVI